MSLRKTFEHVVADKKPIVKLELKKGYGGMKP